MRPRGDMAEASLFRISQDQAPADHQLQSHIHTAAQSARNDLESPISGEKLWRGTGDVATFVEDRRSNAKQIRTNTVLLTL